ncbi:MAG: AgmX/PglI C-terminal domain-containing protein [Gammaproteobacteria bacterium]|nr:MAG: AgmX/PglI C-terminal domain-containing protein [Gammaproteobacteria bacterium]
MAAVIQYRTYALAWDFAREDGDRLRRITRKVFTATFVLTVLLSLLPIPEVDHTDADRIPPRFARLILDQPKPPPPPPVVQATPEEPRLVEQKKPEPLVKKKPEPKPIDKTKEARKKASVAGLLPFADDLAELRDNRAIASVKTDRELAGAAGEAQRAERSMITSKAGKGSGGINTAAMSRDTGGAGLDTDMATTAVSSTVAGLQAASTLRRPDAIGAPARSREEIEMIFDQNKGAIYALYNRALRRDPTLQGKMVLRLTIEPSGAVSMCEVVSSEIEDEEMQRKLIKRIKLFRFEQKDVARITTTKPIDFFPA